MCFNRSHLVKFIKNLRIRVSRKYKFDAKKIKYVSKKTNKVGYRTVYKHDLIKYFLCGEYGTSESGTHRPHYHVLFYVDGRIPPIELSEMISDIWKYGRTDGVKYKGSEYVLKKRVYKNPNQIVLSTVTYVSKYVEKDSYYNNVVESRIHGLIKYLYYDKCNFDNQYYKSIYGRQYYNDVRRCLAQFHLQSQNFGSWLLDNFGNSYKFGDVKKTVVTRDYVDKNMKVNIPDKNKIVLFLQLPEYYKRKLYYHVEKDRYNNKMWVLNADAKPIFANLENDRIENYVKSLKKWLSITSLYNKLRFNELIENRTLNELAEYAIYYRGSVKNKKTSLTYYNVIQDKLRDIDYEHCHYIYNTQSDRIKYGEPFITYPYYTPIEYCKTKHLMKVSDFVEYNCINEKSDYRFRNFDYLIEFIKNEKIKDYAIKQKSYEEKQKIKATLKKCGTFSRIVGALN